MFGFHSRRHSFVSLLARAPGSCKAIREPARHSETPLALGRCAPAQLHGPAGELTALPGSKARGDNPKAAVASTGADDAHPDMAVNQQHMPQHSQRETRRDPATGRDRWQEAPVRRNAEGARPPIRTAAARAGPGSRSRSGGPVRPVGSGGPRLPAGRSLGGARSRPTAIQTRPRRLPALTGRLPRRGRGSVFHLHLIRRAGGRLRGRRWRHGRRGGR